MTYRSKIFLAALGAAAATLAVAALLVSWSLRRQLEARLETTLGSHTGVVAAAFERAGAGADPDDLADELARLVGARVTVIAADGRVVGDSDFDPPQLGELENHADRPEVLAARGHEVGIARRHSTSVGYDMLYSARRLSPAAGRGPAWVRLALPLTEIDEQVAAARQALWPGFAAAVLVALAGAFAISRQLTRRLQAIATAAEQRMGPADPVPSDGTDEIARVARTVNESARALQAQLSVVAADRALLAAILSGMVEGVLVVDPRGRVQLANGAAQQMLGTGARDLGLHYLEIVRHPEIAEHLSRALAGETTAGSELVLRADPARTCVARAAPVAMDDGRRAMGAVLVLHDITDLRRADRVRRDFVANVSHELRTPLTAIRGYVEALLDEAAGGSEQQRFLEVVERHAARMERLVADLLRLARLDAGQERVAAESIRLASIVAAVASELGAAIARKRIRLDARVPASLAVDADPVKLHDVLRNLVENAVNYSPEDGVVTVSAERGDDALLVHIADEGPGIPPSDLDRIFERFYRVDKGRGQDPGGTGLGLAIVKHLVGLHGGTVSAANRSPRGALFTMTLPQRPASPDARR